MGKVVRRRVKHPYSQVMPLTTLDERGVALSGLEVGDLSSRLAHSDVDRFLTYDLERDGARPLCLYLDGRDGGFRVEFGPDAVRVRAKGVCVAVAAEGPGGAAPGGAVEVSTHGQLLDLLYEIAYVLAGATRVSRAGGPAGGSPRDVYVENAHSRPCVKRIGGIALDRKAHV